MANESSDMDETQGAPEKSRAPVAAAPTVGVWARIKEHKIAQWTLAYAAAAYALLDGTKIMSDALDWPHQLLRVVAVLLILGLPVVVTLAWYHGHRALRRVSGAELSIITVLLVLAGGVLWHFAHAPEVASEHPAAASPPASAVTVFSPPPHSVAVLPFVNMSGDKEQEYFSEGLTEEVLNSLARLDELHVAARTSSFSFQGEHPDITTVAHKLNVGAVLEGSVRRAGHTVRITTQLVNGATGFHLWSQTYDRDLRDVLKLQTEIANAVANALKVTLLADAAAKIELGGTTNSVAFDAYLRAEKIANESRNDRDLQAAITGYTDAIRLDRNYAVAYAKRSMAFNWLSGDWAKGLDARNYQDKAVADARQAIALAPNLAEGHLALSQVLTASLEFGGASRECQRALELAPSNATVLVSCGYFAVLMGHTDSGLSAAHRSVELDPLNAAVHVTLGQALWVARHYDDAIVALTHAKALFPDLDMANGWIGFAYLEKGDLQSASAACVTADQTNKELCLAVVYEKLGRHAEAQSMLDSLRKRMGDDFAALYASVYAAWGDTARALNCLDTAMRLHNGYLIYVKTIPNFDSIRKEPRFQAIEKALKFPD